jgi:ketopantoate reductase
LPGIRSAVIWGDGAVGKGLAVTLSRNLRVFLAGPPGSGRGLLRLNSIGSYTGSISVDKIEQGDSVHCDYCIVCVKAFDLGFVSGSAMESTDGYCICVSNGMGLEREWGPGWKDRVEPAVLTAGFCLRDENTVEISEGEVTASSGGLAEELFGMGSLELAVTMDMDSLRWAKWLANSVINPLGALSGLRNDQIIGAGLGTVVDALSSELAAVIPEEFRLSAIDEAGRMLKFLLHKSTNICSMLQDIHAHRRTEIDFLTGLYESHLRGTFPTAAAVTGLVRARSGLVQSSL